MRNAFSGLGFSLEAPTTPEFPHEAFLPESDLNLFRESIDDIIAGLTKWEPETKKKGLITPPKIKIKGKDYIEVVANMNNYFLRNMWGDGLAIFPPTEERVSWILRGTDLSRDVIVGQIMPQGRIATVEALAVSLAMAGGRPEYMPVLIAIIEALADPELGIGGLNATTGSCFPAVVVNGPMAKQIRLGSGYGCMGPDPNHPAGAFTAWAWGVSRIIDGLEIVASAANIDVSRLAMTGCSFAGKIALFAGAFDERIALTIPQESGGGGVATWRFTDYLASQGGDVEQLSRAQGVDWWLASLHDFDNAVPKLPYDHHELMAMVAPRALFVLGNPDMEYLASESGYVGSRATHEVYDALGIPDRFGFSQVGGHDHCQFPSSQQAELAAFVDKFLVGDEDANTDITTSQYDTDLGSWITWDTPTLE